MLLLLIYFLVLLVCCQNIICPIPLMCMAFASPTPFYTHKNSDPPPLFFQPTPPPCILWPAPKSEFKLKQSPSSSSVFTYLGKFENGTDEGDYED